MSLSVVEGRALHSGVLCSVRLQRRAGPLHFHRADTDIPALSDYVTATRRSTSLGRGGVHISLVEHLLAALHVRGWWRDLRIEVSAPELPILDGSAAGWLKPIAALGPPPPPPAPLRVSKRLEFTLEESRFVLRPGPDETEVHIDFAHPAIGQQCWRGTPGTYPEVLSARTFGFLSDLKALHEAGLASHASLENAIVFDDTGPVTPLRSLDEPARHKALDLLGDLFLLGRPLSGNLRVHRGSHRSHVAFVRHVLASTAFTPRNAKGTS